MKNFKWLKVIAFILALCIPLLYIAECYSFPTSYVTRIIETFYEEKENTIDGVAVGTSVIGMGWAPPAGWSEYGMTVSNLGTTIQPFGAIPEVIEFARKKQDIKFVVIDIHAIRRSAIMNSVNDMYMRRLYLSMRLGPERYKMLKVSLDYAQRIYDYYGYPENESDIVTKNKLSYYVPFYDFHNRWKDKLRKADFTSVENKFKGSFDTSNTFNVFDTSKYLDQWDCRDYKLDSFQISEIDKLLDYTDQTGLDVLFINYPSFRGYEDESQLQEAADYIEQKGYDIINFADKELLDKMGFDVSKDFKDTGHLNSKGSCKIVKYVCSYLKEKYGYEDHRGQEGYESWDIAADEYEKFLKENWLKYTGEEFTFKTAEAK